MNLRKSFFLFLFLPLHGGRKDIPDIQSYRVEILKLASLGTKESSKELKNYISTNPEVAFIAEKCFLDLIKADKPDYQTIISLLSAGVNPNAKVKETLPPFIYHYLEVSTRFQLGPKRYQEKTALMIAIERNNYILAYLLLKFNANPLLTDGRGRTARDLIISYLENMKFCPDGEEKIKRESDLEAILELLKREEALYQLKQNPLIEGID